jgi:hypothetical protein
MVDESIECFITPREIRVIKRVNLSYYLNRTLGVRHILKEEDNREDIKQYLISMLNLAADRIIAEVIRREMINMIGPDESEREVIENGI